MVGNVPNAAHAAAVEFLMSRIDYERSAPVSYGEREYKLDRMRELLRRLGNPQDALAIVHVAGTKGKGSCCAILSQILISAGLRTGVFSSPHLDRIEERMAVDGLPCPEDPFVDLVEELRPIVEQMDAEAVRAGNHEIGPTYFELTTALALLHFARSDVDLAILEVGMGGRLDSTNVCRSRCTVITSISLDHTRQLGDTLAKIAREKAGIIKQETPIISGVIDPEPREVIAQIAREMNAPLIQRGRDFDFEYNPPRQFEKGGPLGTLLVRSRLKADRQSAVIEDEPLELGLLGRHQAANAAVALAVVEQLRGGGFEIPPQAVRQGLAEARCPARIEQVANQPTVIIDAAHNPASVAALVEVLEDSFSPGQRTLIFATTRDKDVRGMLELLLPRFDRVVLTRYKNNPRGVAIEQLLQIAAELGHTHCSVAEDPQSAWLAARSPAS